MQQMNEEQLQSHFKPVQQTQRFLEQHKKVFESLLVQLSSFSDSQAHSHFLSFLGKLLGRTEEHAVNLVTEYQKSMEQQNFYPRDISQIMTFFQFIHKQGNVVFLQKLEDQQPEVTPAPSPQPVIEPAIASQNQFEQIKQSSHQFALKLQETILKYEQSLKDASQKDRPYIIRTIASLSNQLQLIQASSVKQPLHAPKENKKFKVRAEMLKEVFEFYSKMSHALCPKGTFDRIKHETNVLNWQKVISMLKDFGIYKSKVDKGSIESIYKKIATHRKEINYQGFLELLQNLAAQVFPDKPPPRLDHLLNDLIAKKFNFRTNFKKLPFDTKEKEDFRSERINSYNFNMVPHSGKGQLDLRIQLQGRRQMRVQLKQEQQRKLLRVKQREIPRKRKEDKKSLVVSLDSLNSIPINRSIQRMISQIKQLDSQQEQLISNGRPTEPKPVAEQTKARAQQLQKDEINSSRRRVEEVLRQRRPSVRV